jgi:hypothetical protein
MPGIFHYNFHNIAWAISLRFPELMLMLPPFCWVHLACDSGWKYIYLKSSILIINYSAISAGIGGRNWMDGSSANWMTFPFWEALQIWNILMDLVDC